MVEVVREDAPIKHNHASVLASGSCTNDKCFYTPIQIRLIDEAGEDNMICPACGNSEFSIYSERTPFSSGVWKF